VRRTTTKTAKDQKTSSRAPAGEEREYVHVSSVRLRAEQEDNGQKTVYRPCYPRQGGDLGHVWRPLPQEDKGKEDLGAIKEGGGHPLGGIESSSSSGC
jgi:hypothetical protein